MNLILLPTNRPMSIRMTALSSSKKYLETPYMSDELISSLILLCCFTSLILLRCFTLLNCIV
jgi:hypothetical protein